MNQLISRARDFPPRNIGIFFAKFHRQIFHRFANDQSMMNDRSVRFFIRGKFFFIITGNKFGNIISRLQNMLQIKSWIFFLF